MYLDRGTISVLLARYSSTGSTDLHLTFIVSVPIQRVGLQSQKNRNHKNRPNTYALSLLRGKRERKRQEEGED